MKTILLILCFFYNIQQISAVFKSN